MGIANRRGDVPSINVSFRIDGRPFKGVLHSDGELVIQNRREQQLTEHGKLMTYLVQLSSNHQGIDFGAHYAFDARKREEVAVFVAHMENERLAVEDILGGRTQFGDVVAIAEHGARVIQSAASPRRILATRPSPR
jgi:hypothetical protein